jgi:hypothetical protein
VPRRSILRLKTDYIRRVESPRCRIGPHSESRRIAQAVLSADHHVSVPITAGFPERQVIDGVIARIHSFVGGEIAGDADRDAIVSGRRLPPRRDVWIRPPGDICTCNDRISRKQMVDGERKGDGCYQRHNNLRFGSGH